MSTCAYLQVPDFMEFWFNFIQKVSVTSQQGACDRRVIYHYSKRLFV